MQRALLRCQRLVAIIAVVSLGGTIPTISLAQSDDPREVVIGAEELIDSLDPGRGFVTSVVFRATYDTLVTFPDDGVGDVVPRLASGWQVSDDGLSYTFTLRDNVKFDNGDPLTADDVVFSIQRLRNLQGNPSFLAEPVSDVIAIDERTVRIGLNEPTPDFLIMLANSAMSIVNARVVQEHGGSDAANASQTDKAEDYLNGNSAGTGPYVLERWDRLERVVLTRNPNYWGSRPYFDRVVIVDVPTAAARSDALLTGEIDVALDLGPDQLNALAADGNIEVYQHPGEIIHYLAMNQDPAIGGPMADPRVQLAVRYALDYDGYRELWSGSITPGSNLMVGLPAAYGPDRAFKQDLVKARSLLEEAGYPDGFEITLDYPDITYGGIVFSTNAQKIQEDLARVSIDVTLRPGEFSVSLESYRQGEQAFGYWLWGPNILSSSDLLSFLPAGAAAERVNWDEATADAVIVELRNKAAVEQDPERRQVLYSQIQDYLQQQGPWAPFLQPASQAAFRADIHGFRLHPSWQFDVALLSRID